MKKQIYKVLPLLALFATSSLAQAGDCVSVYQKRQNELHAQLQTVDSVMSSSRGIFFGAWGAGLVSMIVGAPGTLPGAVVSAGISAGAVHFVLQNIYDQPEQEAEVNSLILRTLEQAQEGDGMDLRDITETFSRLAGQNFEMAEVAQAILRGNANGSLCANGAILRVNEFLKAILKNFK